MTASHETSFELRAIFKFYFKLGKTPKEMFDDIEKAYGRAQCTLQTVCNWYERFKEGDETLEDKKRIGRPIEEKRIEDISKKIKEKPLESARRIALEIDCTHPTVLRIAHEILNLRQVPLKFVPFELTEELRGKRVYCAKKMIKILRETKDRQYYGIITGDESWFYLDNPASKVWIEEDEEVPTHPSKKIGAKKEMMTAFFSTSGIHVMNKLPEEMSMNSDYYLGEIIRPALESAFKKFEMEKIILHQDNSAVHKAGNVMKYLDGCGVQLMPHPPYSPDIAPADFYLWGKLKGELKGKSFDSYEALFSIVQDLIKKITEKEILSVFGEWEKRLDWVIVHNGEYFTK